MQRQEKHPESQVQRPCPFCGHLLSAQAQRCEACKMAVDDRTVAGLSRLLGPWFVLDPNAPSAPGLNWEKFLAHIQKGRVTPQSVVRGPTTLGLWRFAADTPLVATQFGRCWSCHQQLPDINARHCPHCGLSVNHLPGQSSRHRDKGDTQVAPATATLKPDRPPVPDYLRPAAASARPAVPAVPEYLRDTNPVLAEETSDVPQPQLAEQSKLSVGTVLLVAVLAALAAILIMGLMRLRPRSTPPPRRESPPPALPERSSAAPAMFYPLAYRPSLAVNLPTRAIPATALGVMPSSQPARSPAASRPAASQPATASGIPATSNLPPVEFARQKELCAALLAQARRHVAAGEAKSAEKLLVDMLNSHAQDLWPVGAVDLLKTLQGGATSQPVGAGTELEAQKQAARQIYQRVGKLKDDGDLVQAANLLAGMLNEYPAEAWPAGARQEYDNIAREVAKPASRPSFFGVESRK